MLFLSNDEVSKWNETGERIIKSGMSPEAAGESGRDIGVAVSRRFDRDAERSD